MALTSLYNDPCPLCLPDVLTVAHVEVSKTQDSLFGSPDNFRVPTTQDHGILEVHVEASSLWKPS